MEIIGNGESETQRIKGWIAFDKRMIVNVRIEQRFDIKDLLVNAVEPTNESQWDIYNQSYFGSNSNSNCTSSTTVQQYNSTTVQQYNSITVVQYQNWLV